MTGLRIGTDGFELPLEFVVEASAILAMRGAGKTYLAKDVAEEVLDAQQQLVILDPKGDLWGLKSTADGQRDAYPIYIFGGEHANAPLEETAGEVLADVVVDAGVNVILDLSDLSKAGARRFVADFLERLYWRKRRREHQTALLVIIDEADAFIPQRIVKGGERCYGAVDTLVRRGRGRGLGTLLVTQRPAVIAKDVLTQVAVLIAMRIGGRNDIVAIDAWIQAHGDVERASELKGSLPSLPTGTAWVWAPYLLGGLFQVTVRASRTFDSSATPAPGQRRVEPKKLAPVDMAALGERIAATLERAKADDPKELRKRIADLERQLRDVPVPEPVHIDVPVLTDADRAVVDTWRATVEAASQQWVEVVRSADALAARIATPQTPVTGRPSGRETPHRGHPSRPAAPSTATPVAERRPAGDGSTLAKGERVVLTAIAQYPEGVTKEHLTVLTGYKRSSRDTYLKKLRAAALISSSGDRFVATADGVDALGEGYQPLPVGAALRNHWLNTLPMGEQRILRVLVDAYPLGVSRDEISERTDYLRSSRDTYLKKLRARQLMTTDDEGQPRAADVLFEN